MELVIFSSAFSIAAMAAVLVLYAAYAVTAKFMGEDGLICKIIAALNIAVHVALFALCIYLKASLQEILFIVVVSAAVALTVTKHEREEQ